MAMDHICTGELSASVLFALGFAFNQHVTVEVNNTRLFPFLLDNSL